MTRSTIVEDGVRVPMRDGVHIVMDIHRPAASAGYRCPAILMRSYGRRFGDRNPMLIRDLLDAGYAYVNSEVRGRGGLGGEWRPEHAGGIEGPDGYDSIAWLAEQPWCDGNVGMIGASHMAAMQYLAAMQHPPQLKAIAPWTGGGPGSGGSGFRPARSGGVVSFITTLVWLPNEAPGVLDNLERDGQDVTRARALLARARSDPAELYNYLPLLETRWRRRAGSASCFAGGFKPQIWSTSVRLATGRASTCQPSTNVAGTTRSISPSSRIFSI